VGSAGWSWHLVDINPTGEGGTHEHQVLSILAYPAGSASVLGSELPVDSGILLFMDDFQDGQPDNWQTSGAWYVEQNGELYYFGAAGRGWAWVPSGHSWSDYIFHAGVRLDSGNAFLSMNLTKEGRYLLRLGEQGVYLIKEQPAGNVSILAQTGPISMGTGHSVTLAAQAGHLQVYVDQALWIDLTDPAPIAQGTIGVSSLEGARVAVDNVLVVQPTGPLPSGVVEAPPPLEGESLTAEDIEQELSDAPLQEVEMAQAEQEEQSPASGGQPDLVATEVQFDPDPVVQGQPFNVSYILQNQGSAEAGAFTVRLHFHAATGLADCNADFPSLAPGLSAWGGCTRVTNAQPGSSPTEFTVDVENEIEEIDEGNNLLTPTLSVVQVSQDGGGEVQPEGNNGSEGLPDLVAVEVHFEPDPIIQGQPFTVFYTITNQGDAPANPFTVRLHFNPNTGLADCNDDFGNYAAGVTSYLECTRTTNAQPGGYRTDLTVDVEGEIAESDEGNNTINQPMTVAAP
jgi:hypothetical protein